MKHLISTKIRITSIILLFGIFSLLAGSIVTVGRAFAESSYAPNPSVPNCYTERPSGPLQTSCPTDARLVKGHCYDLNQRGTVWKVDEIDCGTGSPTGQPFEIDTSTPVTPPPAPQTTGSNQLDNWLKTAVNLLSGLVGIVIVISIIVAGIQYMTAGDNASQVAAAKNRIAMAVLSFILFAFAFVLLQWLVPGGIF